MSRTQYAMRMLELAGQALLGAAAAAAALEAGRRTLETMVAEGRDPSPAEWAELDARLADARARLHRERG